MMCALKYIVISVYWDVNQIKVFCTFGVLWVMPQTVRELIEGWQGLKHHQSRIWTAVPHCIMWCLWRERNSRTFEDRVNY
jgi:hypothetical protein